MTATRERIERIRRNHADCGPVTYGDIQFLIETATALTALCEEMEREKPVEVIDLTKMQIITRAIQYPVKWECGTPRWSAVGAIFGLGSTSSQALCRLCGQNPNDIKLRNGRIKLATLPQPPAT